MAGEKAIDCQNLSKEYRRGVPALDGIDLDIVPGSTTALVGPNGAGKSSLIKILMGFERPTSGRALIFGSDPWRERSRAIPHVAYVPQKSALYRDLTVEDHLRLAAGLRPRFDTSSALRHIHDLGIRGRALASELSGGEAAQLALAIALGTRAELLLLDEPLASLDPLARREFLAIVVRAARYDGTTVVMSSHLIGDVERACERVAILGSGRLLVHSDLGAMLSTHVVGPLETMRSGSFALIGEFPGLGDARDALSRCAPNERLSLPLRRPTPEELVIGYLAGGRSRAVDGGA
jgi:ABC-2 type transport system ATP-binding protein